ncbi:pirin-like C-terminal cupin domain-containing protein [Polyangium aurulentum]|uniref:pirin-like C-terminal cupin domain-containing protein n=1 Tax=Polyangium aurulentum TaxID=2567896 RepID=UPI0023DF4F1B|nr:pirin-like C-terminal cupin domain-containing protein [Polyangium aurulentum]
MDDGDTGFLVMERGITINDKTKATTQDFVVFANIGERVVIEAREKAHLLVLNGEPIHEPVVQSGPFVMNSEREIAHAFADFDSGKFGYLGLNPGEPPRRK